MDAYVPFPIRGLSENFAFGLQEPGTTRDCLNVRGINPLNGRIMGAQRCGLTNHSTNQVNGSNKIQELAVIGYDSGNVLWGHLENEVSWPEDFTTNYWTTGSLSVTSNSTNAPDGTLTADLLTDASNDFGFIRRNFSASTFDWMTNGQEAFASIHLRLNGHNGDDKYSFLSLWHINTNEKRHAVRLNWMTTPPSIQFRSNASMSWRDPLSNDPVILEGEENSFYRVGVGNTLDTSLASTLRMELQPIYGVNTDNGSVWAWGAQYERGTNGGPYIYRNATTVPSKAGAVNVKPDQYGNLYVLDEKAHITKYSPDLTEVWNIALPLTDQSHTVRALHIDRTGCVYAGVSEGGRQERATIWKYIQLPEDEYELWWTLEVGQYTEEIKSFQHLLYTAQNDDGTKKSRIAVYDQLVTREPVLAWETGDTPVAYPIRGMDLNSSGDVLVACDEPVGSPSGELFRLTAGTKGAPRTFYPVAIDAEPEEILHPGGDETSTFLTQPFSANVRLWAHYRAVDVDEDDVEGELEEGATVLRLRDISGNQRHLTVPDGDEGPTLTFLGPGGKAALRFNGSNQALESQENGSTARPNRDQQRTILPGYDNCQWAAVMLVRPEAASNQSCVLSQQNTGTNSFEFGFWANRDEGSTTSNPAYGQFSVFDDTTNSLDNATGTDAHPLSGSYTNSLNNAVIVSYLNNGNLGTPGSAYSVFRLNGTNVELNYYSADFLTSNARSYLGRDAAGSYYFKGDFSELLVISGADNTSWVEGQSASGQDAYPLRDTTPNTNGVFSGAAANGLEYLEGYVAYAYGMYSILPGGASVTNGHRHGLDSNGFAKGPPSVTSNVISENASIGQSFLKYPFVAKISSENGSFVWLVNENTTNATGSNAGGVGYGVVVDHQDNVLSIGPNASGTNATNAVRKIADNGDSASVTGSNTWVVAWGGEFPEYKIPRMAVDHSNNLYVPIYNANLNNGVRIYSGTNGTELYGFPLIGRPDAYAVAVDPIVPDYGDDLSPERAANMYVVTDNMDDKDQEVLHKIPLVKESILSVSPRTFQLIALSGSILKNVTDPSNFTVPTRAVGAVGRKSRYVQSAVLNERLYVVDGKNTCYYDPKENEVVQLKASIGRVPRGAQLVESWRGRLVLGRTSREPQNWFMSRRDDATDWQFVTFQADETQAVSGNDSEAGLFPDILNTLVPWSEDVLIFGGDRTIYQMSGDPAAGGRFDLITDKTGMAFGRPWTKDPNGVLYFWGSRGGLYRMTPGSVPERVSVNRIERRLQDINYSTYYVRLEYNWRDEGVHILLCPYGSGGTQVEHYFYEIKTDSFWPDKFGTSSSTGVQPTAVTSFDGDSPDDRAVFFGCEDGRVRRWDNESVNDGGTAIDSYAVIDLPRTPGWETIYKGLTVILGHSQSGVHSSLHVGQNPDDIGPEEKQADLLPGRNPTYWDRVRGSHGWLRFRNAQKGKSWSVEEILIDAEPVDRARKRHD